MTNKASLDDAAARRTWPLPDERVLDRTHAELDGRTAAHEIRGALSVLSIYIELLRTATADGEVPEPSWIEAMSSSVSRAASVAARISSRPPEPRRAARARS